MNGTPSVVIVNPKNLPRKVELNGNALGEVGIYQNGNCFWRIATRYYTHEIDIGLDHLKLLVAEMEKFEKEMEDVQP